MVESQWGGEGMLLKHVKVFGVVTGRWRPFGDGNEPRGDGVLPGVAVRI